jgi:hypothetical protein
LTWSNLCATAWLLSLASINSYCWGSINSYCWVWWCYCWPICLPSVALPFPQTHPPTPTHNCAGAGVESRPAGPAVGRKGISQAAGGARRPRQKGELFLSLCHEASPRCVARQSIPLSTPDLGKKVRHLCIRVPLSFVSLCHWASAALSLGKPQSFGGAACGQQRGVSPWFDVCVCLHCRRRH